MSTKSGTQRASAGQARAANATVLRRNQKHMGPTKNKGTRQMQRPCEQSWQKPNRPSKGQDGKEIPVNEMDGLDAMLTTELDTAKENSALKTQTQLLEMERKQQQQQIHKQTTSARRDNAPLLRAPARQGCCRSSGGTRRERHRHRQSGRDPTSRGRRGLCLSAYVSWYADGPEFGGRTLPVGIQLTSFT